MSEYTIEITTCAYDGSYIFDTMIDAKRYAHGSDNIIHDYVDEKNVLQDIYVANILQAFHIVYDYTKYRAVSKKPATPNNYGKMFTYVFEVEESAEIAITISEKQVTGILYQYDENDDKTTSFYVNFNSSNDFPFMQITWLEKDSVKHKDFICLSEHDKQSFHIKSYEIDEKSKIVDSEMIVIRKLQLVRISAEKKDNTPSGLKDNDCELDEVNLKHFIWIS